MKPLISYYRVSTARQGASGLGLEAQQAAAYAFAQGQGRSITREYTEVESGKKDERPQLLAAIAEARGTGATLLIAKLDRLSRNAGFIFALRDSGVDFIAADLPEANTLTIGIFAVMAQHERETISKRTKDALAAKKARGCTLGNASNFTAATRALGPAARSKLAQDAVPTKQARRLAELLRGQGKTTREIAAELNENGYRTRTNAVFHPTTVTRLLAKQ